MKSRLLLIAFLASFTSFGQGNSLPSVTIGEQIWTSTNLSVSTFRNGNQIPQSKNKEEWFRAGYREEPTWCYYDFDVGYEFLGKLYNYYAVSSDKNIAPIGWKVPDTRDYIELFMFLDPLLPSTEALHGSLAAGSLRKDMSNEEWDLPKGVLKFDSSNECPQIKSGFNAIPSGGYSPSLNFPQYDWDEIGEHTCLWCITDWNQFISDAVPEDQRERFISQADFDGEAICITIMYWNEDSGCKIGADNDPKLKGRSVRLIKD